MELVHNELYKRQDIAKKLSAYIIGNHCSVIGITGTSCVGKSTFTEMLTRELGETVTFQVINVDSYLKEEYRAGTKMWKGPEPYLMPKHFDWEQLERDVESLKSGKDIQKQMYIRGSGWSDIVTLFPRDVLILEGLFLDSEDASKFMKYDLLTVLTADDEMIRKKRMERDDYYREHFTDFRRTKEETLLEVEQTLKAGKSYSVCKDKWNCLKLKIQENYQVRIAENNII